MGPFSPRPMKPMAAGVVEAKEEMKTPRVAAAPARESVLKLTMSGLDVQARDTLEQSLIAASKSGRCMISIFWLVPHQDENQPMTLQARTVRSQGFPIGDFNMCQDHLHQHLVNMSVETTVPPLEPTPVVVE